LIQLTLSLPGYITATRKMNGSAGNDSGAAMSALYKEYERFQQVDTDKRDFMTVGGRGGWSYDTSLTISRLYWAAMSI
jgi:hypothetical protein